MGGGRGLVYTECFLVDGRHNMQVDDDGIVAPKACSPLVVEADTLVEESVQRAAGVGVADVATALPTEIVQAAYAKGQQEQRQRQQWRQQQRQVSRVLGEYACTSGGDGEPTAGRAQRREHLVDPVILVASWEWLQSLPLSEVFACPSSSAGHVSKRAKDEFVGVMRWMLLNLDGDSEDFWQFLVVAPRMLLSPPPGPGRCSSQRS
ncbi:hypothetical protein CYMTET_55606 [Cymbomonas tetramitiformis]|uniref:Uncharacterized protein n=1 Tax=Cymbomonas tetramitiformis TaxID=36881 RepID=A0AAE0BEG1_9CHLO|nr:hypothetical protein CYMTET_55606 [Cymbomonas tetramitiformis]